MFYQFSKVFPPHEDHAVKEFTQTRRCIYKMREKSEKSREKMINVLARKWHVADGRYEDEFIANFRLSRSSFAKLCKHLRHLIKKQETFEWQWLCLSSVNGIITALLRISLVLPYRRFVVSFTRKPAKANNLIPECVTQILWKWYFDDFATFQGKHIPNCVGAIDGSHIVISCAPLIAGLICTIGSVRCGYLGSIQTLGCWGDQYSTKTTKRKGEFQV